MPLRPRGGISRASFPSALPISFLTKEEAERRKAHCFVWRAPTGARTGPRGPVSPDGAPLRRLKTLGPHSSENRHPGRQCASRGDLGTVTLGSIVSRGAIVQG